MRIRSWLSGCIVFFLAGCSASSGGSGASGTPGSTDPSGTAAAFGTVVVRQMILDAGTYSAGATAVFASARESDSSVSCVTSPAGPSCTLTVCNAFPSATATTSESAGDLRLTVGSTGLTLPYWAESRSYGDVGQSFQLPSSSAPLFAGGESLRVTAPGADVPAFDGTVTAPAPVTMTAPTLDEKNNCPLPSGKDYDFTWSGGAPGDTIELVVHGADTNENVTCEFDAAAGHGTVPYLGGLSTIETDAAGNAFLYTSTVHREGHVRAGDYDVTLSAQALATACYVVPN